MEAPATRPMLVANDADWSTPLPRPAATAHSWAVASSAGARAEGEIDHGNAPALIDDTGGIGASGRCDLIPPAVRRPESLASRLLAFVTPRHDGRSIQERQSTEDHVAK
jgi:hypothetical protein